MERYFKVTHGFVMQLFQPDGKGGYVCIDQNFTAGEPVEYENEQGTPIDPPDNEGYEPFNMVNQKTPTLIPERIPPDVEDTINKIALNYESGRSAVRSAMREFWRASHGFKKE